MSEAPQRTRDTERTWDIEVVADSDSRWKWGATLADRLADGRPARVHASLLLGRSVPNDRQLAEVGIEAASLRRATIADTVDRLATSDADVVVLACIGGCVQSLMQALARVWAGRATRPVVVTGYVGLVYEKIVDGLVTRAGADLVLANSAADAEHFAEVYAALGADPNSIVGTALPFLTDAGGEGRAAGDTSEHPYTLTFVAQPGVPETESERRHLLRQAVAYARRYPEREVVFKLRARPGERTTHVEPFHYTKLLPAAELPENFAFAYGAMDPVLDRTDLCVTVSSTAAVEAMHRHIPTAVLTDYGVREILGNSLFLGSGAMTSWPVLLRDEVPVTDTEWASAHGVGAGPDSYTAAATRLADLVARRDSLPPLRPWLSLDRAGGYLPQLLGRYGLDAEARPLVSAAGARNALHRRVARRAALKFYRYGVDVLEPRIKRMAQI